MYDFVVIGAGFTGATCAQMLHERGKSVLVVDSADRVGGASADATNDIAMLAPLHGPHFFHTNSLRVWEYVNRFGSWFPYEQRTITRHAGKLYTLPVNANTIESFYDVRFEDETECAEFLEKLTRPYAHLRNANNSRDRALASMGEALYEAFFQGYTRKHWFTGAENLSPAVIARVPVRTNWDDRYFTDRYQAMPAAGYTTFMKVMLGGIDVTLNKTMTLTEAKSVAHHVIWTGPIDDAYDNAFGPLPWRSRSGSTQYINNKAGRLLPASVVHEADAYVPFMRTIDCSYFNPAYEFDATTHLFEISEMNGPKYYPMLSHDAVEPLEKYKALARKEYRVAFLGRQGRFRYINMDQAILDAFKFVDEVK